MELSMTTGHIVGPDSICIPDPSFWNHVYLCGSRHNHRCDFFSILQNFLSLFCFVDFRLEGRRKQPWGSGEVFSLSICSDSVDVQSWVLMTPMFTYPIESSLTFWIHIFNVISRVLFSPLKLDLLFPFQYFFPIPGNSMLQAAQHKPYSHSFLLLFTCQPHIQCYHNRMLHIEVILCYYRLY